MSTPEVRLTQLSHCAGWAAKLGPEDLAQVLGALPAVTDPNVLVGTATADDGAVYRLTDELALVQTLDFFTPVVDDPYEFGAIAAANALSDVYAMGGRPIFALNIVGFPRDSKATPLSVLAEIIRGGVDKVHEAGIHILGGHSIDDPEPKYGLCVTGVVHPDRYWTNVGGQPGDALILTKPIGTGIISTALRSGTIDAAATVEAVTTMAALNRAAAEAADGFGVHACTDVTGFGLLGHLREMVADQPVGAEIRLSAVPLLAGAADLAAGGAMPGGTRRNHASVAPQVRYDPSLSEVDQLLLCDAQTSGGLLFALDAAEATTLLEALTAKGVHAAVIGEIVAEHPGSIAVAP